jgi:hypothetical protein
MGNGDPIERLRRHWLSTGIRVRSGVPVHEVEAFERRYQVHLPADFRWYFTALDGMEQGEADPEMFSFLPLRLVRPIPEELAQFAGIPDYSEIMETLPEPHRWFVFVDYLIFSAVYAIRLSASAEGTPVIWIGHGRHHRIMASSFSSFMETYLANPCALL